MIELERKYLLEFDLKAFKDINRYESVINQYYCEDYRLREITRDELTSYIFTKKIKSNNTPGANIEIETEIDKVIFDDLVQNSKSSLTKIRKSIEEVDQHIDIDLFYENNIPYLLTMEIEHISGKSPVIPSFIADKVILDFTNTSFSNYQLSRCSKVKIYEQIIEEWNNG